MMGTDKKQIGVAEVPEGLQEVVGYILDNSATDKEEKFLQLVSLAFNYRQCGIIPEQTNTQIPVAPGEVKSYCSAAAMQALNDIIIEENIPVLKLWLQLCNQQQQIVRPEAVPALLTTGTTQKKLQLLIADCCGKRGEWLATFNSSWNFSSTQTDEERWHTGTIDQRKEILKQTRKTEPHKARDLVQQTWDKEDANTKTSFLEILADNTQQEDITFLESLANEKSKKVRDQAMQLLKQIPGSSIVQLYEKTLGESVTLKKEKGLLGIKSKTVLQFKLPGSVDESIYKSGIDKLCNNKELTDDEHIIHQLVANVPPVFWEQHLQMTPEEIIYLFLKDNTGKKMITALVTATTRFKDTNWAHQLSLHGGSFYIDLIVLLATQDQEKYANKFFDKFPDFIIEYATAKESEWNVELAMNICRHAARNPYQYNRTFFNENIHLIPAAIVPELERSGLQEEWRDHIIKLVNLKTQSIKAFNS